MPTTTLVDSNVILDLVTDDDEWGEWSASMLEQHAEQGALAINPIIYAEVSVRFDAIEELDDTVPAEYFTRLPLPWPAAFLAAKVFQRYRARGGTRTRPLPDFFIGAHAAVAGMPLLTRDPRRYRQYFPTVQLIAP